MIDEKGIIGRRGDVVLGLATEADLDAIDDLTVEGYRAIQESYVSMLGERCYEAVPAAAGAALGRAEDPPEPRPLRRASGPALGVGRRWRCLRVRELLDLPGPELRPHRQQRRCAAIAPDMAGRRSCTATCSNTFGGATYASHMSTPVSTTPTPPHGAPKKAGRVRPHRAGSRLLAGPRVPEPRIDGPLRGWNGKFGRRRGRSWGRAGGLRAVGRGAERRYGSRPNVLIRRRVSGASSGPA